MVERHLIQALVAGSEGRGLKCREEDTASVHGMLDAAPWGAVTAVLIQAIVDLSS